MLAGVSAFGGVDVGVASAGVGVDAPVADMDDEGWRRVFDVNLTGPMMMTRAALPLMLERGGGSVSSTNSMAAAARIGRRRRIEGRSERAARAIAVD